MGTGARSRAVSAGAERLSQAVRDPGEAGVKLPEAAIQRMIREYLGKLAIDAIHVPNGSVLAGDAKARAIQTNALKRAGMMPGFPDLLLFDRIQRRVGFMEVKSEGGKLQPSQVAFADVYPALWKWPYAVVRSIDDAKETLAEWGWRS